MPSQVKIFNGKMNQDTELYRVPDIDYIDALNITRDAEGSGKDKVVSNIVGNKQVAYTLPLGVNKRIGSYPDLIRNRIYYFVWNSNGNHSILFYNKSNNTISKLLISKTDSSGVDILNFNPSWRINHVDIIYRDEGDLIFWTDGLNRPFFINEKNAISGLYGTSWLLEYITVARRMPLIAPSCTYKNDTSVSINNLKKKLYQFRYRWVYTNFTKSTWSPYSKVFSPLNPDDIADEINQLKNNRIDVTINTGGADVLKIEIAARIVVDGGFSNCFSVEVVDKALLSLLNNQLYIYQFFNNKSYLFVDPKENLLLFDYVPQKAFAQANANGNTIEYAAITEGYDFDEILDVELTVDSIDFEFSSSLKIAVIYQGVIVDPFTFYVGQLDFSGTPVVGDIYSINFNDPTLGLITISYTVIIGDNLFLIINAITALINAYPFTVSVLATVLLVPPSTTGFSIYITATPIPDVNTFRVVSITYDYFNSNLPTDGVNNSIYDHASLYSYGIVYFDQYGVTNGVITNDLLQFTTPEINTSGLLTPKIPRMTLKINSRPPIWATNFSIVRTSNLTIQNLITTVSCSTQKDTTVPPVYGYIEITNEQKNQNNFPVYEYLEGDRVRVIARVDDAVIKVYDFPIVSLKTNPKINGSVVNGDFLLIPYDATALVNFGTVGYNNYYIQIYTPTVNTTLDQQVYYEFGETYNVLNPGTANRFHAGMTQDQTALLPAIFLFTRGDFYLRTRNLPYNADLSNVKNTWVVDRSVSDKYPSLTNGNGRAFAIDLDARQQYFPTTIRFSQEYQQNTNINQTNRFYPENLDDYDRSNGDIRKLFVEGRNLYVFQKFDVGVVPILTQIVKDTSGNPLEANSDILLNKIQYPYKGKYGIGDVPESFAYYRYAKYFFDNNKNVVCRLSQDGISELSVIYAMNAFFVDKGKWFRKDLNNGIVPIGQVYTGDPTIYGVFDYFTNKYIISLEEIKRYSNPTTLSFRQDPYTLVFSETRDSTEGFECFTSYYPEGMSSLGTQLVSFKNGSLWTHDNPVFCNFFGQQYSCHITVVLNANMLDKKTWLTITEDSNVVWECPEITTQLESYGIVKQQSNLITSDFAKLEGVYHAHFLRDLNSIGGLVAGDTLKGQYIVIKLKVNTPSAFVFINAVTCKSINSPLNSR